MSDDTLAEYLPLYGDRLAVKEFSRRKLGENASTAKKKTHLQKLRRKFNMDMKRKGSSDSDEETKSPRKKGFGNRNAEQNQKRVEVGWLNDDTKIQMYKQVRLKTGGGTRYLVVGRHVQMSQLLDEAKALFFPGEISVRGKITEFEFTLRDYTETYDVDLSATVGQMYEQTKLRILRVYLCSKRLASEDEVDKPCANSSPSCALSTAIVEIEKQKDIIQPGNDRSLTSAESGAFLHTSGSLLETLLPSDVNDLDDEIELGPFPRKSFDYLDDTLEYVAEVVTLPDATISNVVDNAPIVISSTPMVVDAVQTIVNNASEIGDATFEMIDTTPGEVSVPEQPYHDCQYTGSTSTDIILQPPEIDTVRTAVNKAHALYFIREVRPGILRVTLHRCNIQSELIQASKDPEIMQSSLIFKFHDEKAEDASGVSRDAYSSFWEAFMLRSTEGEVERVPLLCPTYGLDEWQSVGRIITKGFEDAHVFPIKLSQVFTMCLIRGEANVSKEFLFDSFLRYISKPERELVLRSITVELDADDKEELEDFLSRMGNTYIPSVHEMKSTMIDISHKKLIQECKYAIDMMAKACKLQIHLPDCKAIQCMYDVTTPTTRKVLDPLKADVNDDAANTTLNHLKRYVRSLEQPMLRKFMHFVTGADVIAVDKIDVAFTKPRGYPNRHPVAHTGGPLLELPSNYPNYPEMRADFDEMLNSNYLRMDIV